jgi:hypothetical protein
MQLTRRPLLALLPAMSIKRTKQASYGRQKDSGEDDDAPDWSSSKKKAPEKTWAEEIEGKTDADFTPYALSTRFAKGALIQHASFGKGVVRDVVGTRIEVLFEAGIKKLGHAS